MLREETKFEFIFFFFRINNSLANDAFFQPQGDGSVNNFQFVESSDILSME